MSNSFKENPCASLKSFNFHFQVRRIRRTSRPAFRVKASPDGDRGFLRRHQREAWKNGPRNHRSRTNRSPCSSNNNSIHHSDAGWP